MSPRGNKPGSILPNKRRTITSNRIAWVGCLSALPACGNALAADNYVELAYAYSTGTYGTSVTTRLNRWVVNAGVLKTRYMASVSIPYVYLDTEGDPTQNGLGDIIASAGYRTDWSKSGYAAAYSVSVKFPTADETKFLGSGETDIGAFATVSKQWRDVIGSLGAGYIVAGNPPGGNYKNVAHFSLNLFKRFRYVGASVYLNYRSAAIEGADEAIESGITAYYVMSGNLGFSADAYGGLTDGSPDYGFQLGIVRWF